MQMGMDSIDVDANTLFDRLRPETLFGGEWVTVYQQHSFTMARKLVTNDVSLFRVEHELCLSPDDTLESMRPEVYYDSRRPTWDSAMIECGVEQLFAPGDAIVWYRPVFGAKSNTLGISCAAVVGVAQAVMDAAPADALCLRWTVRRDFPSKDMHAMVAAPFCTQTGTLQEESGVQRALAIGFRRHSDHPERTAATEIRLLRRVPNWSMEHMAGFYLQRNTCCEHYRLSPVYEEVRSGRIAYVVVCIRKLTRGPPLLPREVAFGGESSGSDGGAVPASGWEPVRDGSTCAWYLQTLLSCIGVPVDVHETLDGQQLVYYQAAFRRNDWDIARAALDSGLWRSLCAAYRKMHGGKHAPKLSLCSPKFRGRLASESRAHATPSSDKPP